jgi:hypothetical protein
MPSFLSVISLLDEVGISRAELDKAVEEASKAKIIETTKAAQQYWRSIAVVGQNVKAHAISKDSDHIIEEGTYRDSIVYKFSKEDGKTVGIVYSNEPQLANWICRGSVHNPRPTGDDMKVADRFNGEVES